MGGQRAFPCYLFYFTFKNAKQMQENSRVLLGGSEAVAGGVRPKAKAAATAREGTAARGHFRAGPSQHRLPSHHPPARQLGPLQGPPHGVAARKSLGTAPDPEEAARGRVTRGLEVPQRD